MTGFKTKKQTIAIIPALLISVCTSHASDKLHVMAMEEFSTAKPKSQLEFKLEESGVIGSNTLEAGDILYCSVIKTSAPKRGKRSAGFSVHPNSYSTNGEVKQIEGDFSGKYAEKIISKDELKNVDKLKVGKKAALTVGNHFVKGFAPAVSLAEGMIKNEDGNRIESGVKQVYKSSVLSYVEKGSEINLKKGDIFYLIFKPENSELSEDYSEED